MKASKSSIGCSVDQPDPDVRFYLFLGQDEAQSRALAARLLEALGATKFLLSASEVRATPAVLVDEAAALNLFGERRLIWIEPATNDVAEAVDRLLEADSVESPVVAIAGSLTKASPLLKTAEASSKAVVFTAYLPNADEAARLVFDLGRRVGLKIDPSIAGRIAESCDNDQAVIARELEKLALYAGASTNSPKELEHEMLDAIGAESSAGDFLKLADLALLGEVPELADTLASLPTGGSEAVPTIRSLQRRLLMLAPARARIERGERIDAVMASFGKALFWKDKPTVEKMLKTWGADELARITQRASTLERSVMFSEVPEREAVAEELFAIARRARASR